jgi:hypothetical protein
MKRRILSKNQQSKLTNFFIRKRKYHQLEHHIMTQSIEKVKKYCNIIPLQRHLILLALCSSHLDSSNIDTAVSH